ncbi:hypothetical protein DMA11_05575 [Marinilabiliaceae bacterium JC017]|nr:hypothetical protein DMA11_05575 [Marinilabiliaceae bacterium JC017]
MKFGFVSLVFTLTISLLFFNSCNPTDHDPLSDPVVQVGEKTLTKGKLFGATPDNLSEQDSLAFAMEYINRWIKAELMLQKAELNLPPEEKDVEQLLEEYRRSLLVHHYQQKLLKQKYSPLITSTEIETYYNNMIDNFQLNEPIFKGLYIVVSNTAPNLDDLKKWYRSDNSEDLVKLESYCYQNAKKYDVFFDNWKSFEQINKKLPKPITNTERVLKSRKYYEISDSLYHYFIAIKDYKLINDTAPLDFVEQKIKAILLNKKRLEFIDKLESDLYEEGLKQKIIKFY